jgi:GNAT superfamily N-acetyltransferase
VLFRVRTTMADRPGSLAELARSCGEEGVNILALQIFPGLDGVTDELVLRVPEGWDAAQVRALVTGAGGGRVTAAPCNDHALVDGPIHYLHALRRLADDPAAAAEMLSRLLDADAVGQGDGTGPEGADTMRLDVGAQRVVLRRREPFTATEHARAAAFADVASELVPERMPTPEPVDLRDGLQHGPRSAGPPDVRLAGPEDTVAVMRMHLRCSADSVQRRYASPLARTDDRFARRLLLAGGGALVAAADREVVGVASLSACEDGVVEVALLVEDGWQRRGLGTRLLSQAARRARGRGATEVVMRSRTPNPALMSLAFASGLRARIRRDGDTVVVTVGVEGLKPLPTPDDGPVRLAARGGAT